MTYGTHKVHVLLGVLLVLGGCAQSQVLQSTDTRSEPPPSTMDFAPPDLDPTRGTIERGGKEIDSVPPRPPVDVDTEGADDEPYAIPRVVIRVYGCGDLNAHIVQGPGGRHCVCNSGFAELGILGCVPQSVVNFFGDKETACEALTCGLSSGGGSGAGLHDAACRACRARAKGRYDAILNGHDQCMQTLRREAQRQCSEELVTCGGRSVHDTDYWSDLELDGVDPLHCAPELGPGKTFGCDGPAIQKCIEECVEGVPGHATGTSQQVGVEAFGLSGGGGLSAVKSYPPSMGFRQMCLSAKNDYLQQSAEVLSACLSSNRCRGGE